MNIKVKVILTVIGACAIGIGLWVYKPAPAAVVPFTFPESPEQGLTIIVADTASKTLAGIYREGDMWVTFESTRGEPRALIYRIREGGGPYEMRGCFRSMFLQPIATVEECVMTNVTYTEDPDQERAGESFQFIRQAIEALSLANVSGLEEQRDFLVRYVSPSWDNKKFSL